MHRPHVVPEYAGRNVKRRKQKYAAGRMEQVLRQKITFIVTSFLIFVFLLSFSYFSLREKILFQIEDYLFRSTFVDTQ